MSWVFDHSKSTLAARLVLLSIANHASATGIDAYPGQKAIADEAHVSVATVRRCVEQLVEMGELAVYPHEGMQGRGGRTNYYEMPAFMASIGVRSDRAHLHTQVRSSCSEVRSSCSEVRSPVSAEPSLEPSIEPRSSSVSGDWHRFQCQGCSATFGEYDAYVSHLEATCFVAPLVP